MMGRGRMSAIVSEIRYTLKPLVGKWAMMDDG